MKKVIYDQDGLGLRDHNLYGLFLLLQAPGVELVGLTTVSGREWSPRQVPRALRVLEQLGRPEIPVSGGAVFPLLNSPARSAAWESLHGPLFDTLCHELHELDEPTDADPFWVPPSESFPSPNLSQGRDSSVERRSSGAGWRADFGADRAKDVAQRRWHSPEPKAEGEPLGKQYAKSISSRGPHRKMPSDRPDATRATEEFRPTEPAAVFLTRMARKHPGEISIVATGPLTNLALACRLDPEFPRLVKEVFFVGGRFMPYSRAGYFTRCPSRREINFRHDPEAAHIVLQAPWSRLVCLPRDLTDPIRVTAAMHAAVARARTPVGRFMKDLLKHELSSKGDALAAALCIEPGLIEASDSVCLDVDLNPHGANYGCLLNWRDIDHCPAHHGPPVEVITQINEAAFAKAFVRWCSAKPRMVGRKKAQKTQKTKRQAA